MRDLGLYVLALLLGALLGLSGGIAASFAVSQSGGSPAGATLSSEGREQPSPPAPLLVGEGLGVRVRVQSDKPPAIIYPDTFQPSPSSPLPAGEGFGVRATQSQSVSFAQWSREQPATALLMPLGDVNLDSVVDIEDLAMMALAFGMAKPDPPWLDINLDGVVNGADLGIVARQFGGGK